MEYKVLIRLYIPEIEQDYDIYIPINKTISQIIILLNKLVNNISGEVYPIKEGISLYNRRTYQQYKPEEVIINTDIKNGTEIVLQ